jgi:hypothetical protein
MRFSLKTMLLLCTAIAVSVAGLLNANVAWAAFFYTAAFIGVLTGFVGALVRRGPERAFWIGFALFGGGYFALALVGENSLARFAPDRQQVQEPKLGTTQLLIWIQAQLQPRTKATANLPQGAVSFSPYGYSYVANTPSGYFIEVGHSIFTLLLALLGGWIAMQFSREARSTPERQ